MCYRAYAAVARTTRQRRCCLGLRAGRLCVYYRGQRGNHPREEPTPQQHLLEFLHDRLPRERVAAHGQRRVRPERDVRSAPHDDGPRRVRGAHVRLHGVCPGRVGIRCYLLLEELRVGAAGGHAGHTIRCYGGRHAACAQRVGRAGRRLCECAHQRAAEETDARVEERAASHLRHLSRHMPRDLHLSGQRVHPAVVCGVARAECR